jgi:hypothetical protein
MDCPDSSVLDDNSIGFAISIRNKIFWPTELECKSTQIFTLFHAWSNPDWFIVTGSQETASGRKPCRWLIICRAQYSNFVAGAKSQPLSFTSKVRENAFGKSCGMVVILLRMVPNIIALLFVKVLPLLSRMQCRAAATDRRFPAMSRYRRDSPDCIIRAFRKPARSTIT